MDGVDPLLRSFRANDTAPKESTYRQDFTKWGFAGWGTQTTAYLAKSKSGTLISTSDRLSTTENEDATVPEAHHAKLGTLASTSIAGNDLLSSCLYTGGICAAYAGMTNANTET